jgi:inner membrane protein
MDSLSQALLGASVAGVAAPAGQRRKALLAGALLGTVPDLDVFIDFGGPVENFTYHRGFSHSLFVLAPFSVLVWMALRRWWAPVRSDPRSWLAAISLALLTHPLLDAHTAYGTQLFWPLDVTPAMWGTLFIIDPLYTLPLLIGVIAASIRPTRLRATSVMRAGLVLSTLYVGWSWTAKLMVESGVSEALAHEGIADAPVFATPTPFNTLLWRAVVMTDDGYMEGFESLAIDEGRIRFSSYPSDVDMLEQTGELWPVKRLAWFSDGFIRAEVIDQRLLISDLRMGQEPGYVFNFFVAEYGNPHWTEIDAEQIPLAMADRALAETWRRIWSE